MTANTLVLVQPDPNPNGRLCQAFITAAKDLELLLLTGHSMSVSGTFPRFRGSFGPQDCTVDFVIDMKTSKYIELTVTRLGTVYDFTNSIPAIRAQRATSEPYGQLAKILEWCLQMMLGNLRAFQRALAYHQSTQSE